VALLTTTGAPSICCRFLVALSCVSFAMAVLYFLKMTTDTAAAAISSSRPSQHNVASLLAPAAAKLIIA
jgi:hypothetical protein